MNRPSLVTLLAVAAVAALLVYLPMRGRLQAEQAQAQELKSVAERTEKELLGYTRYSSFITVGQQALAEHTRLLTATVTREEGTTQVIERTLLPGLSSTGTVAIWYTVEYSFGFDLRPDQYTLQAVSSGLEIHVKKPALVATPAVTNLKYKVLSGGILTDEKAAALRLYEQAAAHAQTQGQAMTVDPAVQALCEKKLTDFLYGVLSQQPGVKIVPRITVVYR